MWTQFSDFVATVAIGVMSLISVLYIADTPFIDFCILHISSLKGMIQPILRQLATILTKEEVYRYPRHYKASILAATVPVTKLPRDKTTRYVRRGRQVHITPYSELVTKLRSDQLAIVSIAPLWSLTAKRNIAVHNECPTRTTPVSSPYRSQTWVQHGLK